MSMELPQEGQWYRHRSEVFLVIGVHEDEFFLDVLDEYGYVDQLDFEEWESMQPQVCDGLDDGGERDAKGVLLFPVD